VGLLTLAFVFGFVLLPDANDNAYIAMVLIALLLVLTAVPFAVAFLLPEGSGRVVALRAGLVALIASTALGVLILIDGLSSLDQYEGKQRNDLRLGQILGLVVLIPSCLANLASYYRKPSVAALHEE
jgi:hypothetical protein